MKIEFNKDEIGMLTAMVVAIGKDVENGLFDQDDDEEMVERAKRSFSSLSAKVLMANLKLAADGFEGVMDAVILDEEE